jgi:hypothetical protein
VKHFQKSSRIQNQHAKSVTFLYTDNEFTEKEIRKTIPYTIASKKKYLGINLAKKIKDIYPENDKRVK